MPPRPRAHLTTLIVAQPSGLGWLSGRTLRPVGPGSRPFRPPHFNAWFTQPAGLGYGIAAPLALMRAFGIGCDLYVVQPLCAPVGPTPPPQARVPQAPPRATATSSASQASCKGV